MSSDMVLQRGGDGVMLVEGQEGRVEGRRRRGLQPRLQLLGGPSS